MTSKHRKVVVLGSRNVGKSALTIQYAQKRWEPQYNPTIESTYKKEIRIKGSAYHTDVIDTAGQDEFSIFQQQYAIGVDGYVIVYSITNKQSFELVKTINDKILNATGNENVPRIIVGNKSDLNDQRKVSLEQGEALAKELNIPFLECSALKNEHVDDIFVRLIAKVEGVDISNTNGARSSNDGGCTIL